MSRFRSVIDYINSLSNTQKLLLIVLLGFLFRLFVTLNAVVIAVDSIGDLSLAQGFLDGNYRQAISVHRPPLHPFLVSLFSYVFTDLELSARVVSLVFGTLVIPLGYYFGRSLFSERVGLVTALFIAIHPYLIRYSAETLREGLYHFFVIAVVFAGYKAVSTRSLRWAFVFGLAAFLGYMTKQIAMGFVLIISFWIVFYDIRRFKADWQKIFLQLILSWSVFFATALPYLIYINRQVGTTISERNQLTKVTFTGKATSGLWRNIYEVITFQNDKVFDFIGNFPEGLTIPFFLLLIIYLYKRYKERFTLKEYFIFSIIIPYFALYTIWTPEKRYIVQMMPILLVLPALGLLYIYDWFKVREPDTALRRLTFVLIFIIITQLPIGLVSLRAHRLPEKLAGKWLLEQEGDGIKIFDRKPITAYYAKGVFFDIPNNTTKMSNLIVAGKAKKVRYLVGYPGKLQKNIKDFKAEEARLLTRVKSFKAIKEKEFVVYTIN